MNIGQIVVDAVLNLNPLKQGAKDLDASLAKVGQTADKSFKQAEKSGNGLVSMFKNLFSGAVMGAGMAGFNALATAVKGSFGAIKGAVIDLNGQLESSKISWGVLLGSSEAAQKQLDLLYQFAAKTPFEFPEVEKASRVLETFGGAALNTQDNLTLIGNVAAGVGQPFEDVAMWTARMYDAFQSGKPFGEAAARLQEMGAISGTARTRLEELQASGAKGPELWAAFNEEVARFNQNGGMMAQLANSWQGRLATLSDTVNGLLARLGKPIFDLFNAGLGKALDYTARPEFTAQMDRLVQKVSDISAAFVAKLPAALDKLMALKDGIMDVVNAVGQIRDAATKGDFTGGGPFAEDSALIAGIFRVRDAIAEMQRKYDALVEKMANSQGTALGRAGGEDTPGLPKAAGVAVGAAAGLAGVVALAPGVTALIGPVMSLVTSLGSLGIVLGVVALAAGALYLAWQTNFLGIQDITKEAFGNVKTAVTEAQPAFDAFVAQSGARLDEWGAKVQDVLGQLSAWFNSGPKQSLQDLQGVWAWTFGDMAKTTEDLWNQIGPKLGLMWSSFQTLGTVIGSVVGPVVSAMRDDLGPAIQEVLDYANATVPLLASAWQNVASIIGPLISGIATWIGQMADNATRFIIDHREQITSILQNTWDQAKAIVALAWDLLSGLLRAGLQLLSGDWRAAWETIKQTGQNVWNDIVSFFQAGWETFKIIVGGAMDWVHQKITDKWNEIKTVVGGATDALRATLDSWSDGLVTKLNTWSDTIGGFLMKPFTSARDAIGGVMKSFSDNLIGPLRSGLSSFGNFGGGVAGVVNWILRAFKQPEIGVPPVPALAQGTDNFQGGPAIVGERGPELVILPKGAVVLPNHITRQMLAGGVPGFAEGLNLPSLFDIISKGKDWLIEQAMKAVPAFKAPELPGVMATAGAAFFTQTKEWLGKAVAEFAKNALPVGPEQVQKMIAFAESQMGLGYIYGGGHGGGLGGPGVGWDCSGFVAAVLDAGGIPNPHGIVTSFYEWMTKDGGNGAVDIGISDPYADPTQQHTGIRLMGTQYESGGPFGGVGKDGTHFQEYGSPPNFNPKAKGGLTGDGLEHVDWQRSLANIKRGIHGNWGAIQKYAYGGIIPEPVYGVGDITGRPYLFGESGPERVTPAGGMRGHFPEDVIPDPNHPGWWVGVMTGTVYRADGSVVSSPVGGLPGGPRPTTPSGLPTPGGMVGHFPEPVVPHPGHPGWWVGVNTGKVYDGNGNEQGGPQMGLGLPGPATIIPSVSQPAPTSGAGRGRDGETAPATPAGGKGGSSGGGATRTIRLEIAMPSGKVIVHEILIDPDATGDLADAVTTIQADEEEAIVDTGGVGVSPGPRLGLPFRGGGRGRG